MTPESFFSVPLPPILIACLASLLAGFVDSMVGGGGLIQLPALLLVFPSLPFADVSSVNKMASFAGTLVATARYLRHVKPDARRVAPGAVAAVVFSSLGAWCATVLDTAFLRPLVVVILAAVAVHTFVRRDFGGHVGHPALPAVPALAKILAVCGVLGFYDGFFGPGTGSFFTFFLVLLFGLDFLAATAESKILNLGTNAAAIITLAARGHFHPDLFLPLAACNVTGSLVGTQLALRKGSGFVRKMFLCIVVALLARLVFDMFAK